MNGRARQIVLRSSPAPPVATRRVNLAKTSETDEDRLGARRLWQESRQADRRDVWSETAEIIARLLSASPLPEPTLAPVRAPSLLPGAAAVPAEAVVPTEAPQAEGVQAASATGRSDRNAAQRTLLAATSKPTPDTLAAPGKKKPVAGQEEPTAAPAPEAEPAAPAPAVAARMPGMQEATADPSEAPTVVVQRWRQGVLSAGAAVPRVNVSRTSSGALDKAKADAKAKGEQARGVLGKEATANLPPTPQVDNPPSPPPSNPIPRETQAIIDASGKRLANQLPPLLIPSPVHEIEEKIIGGSLPRLDQKPIPPDLFNVLITPGAFALSKIDTTAKGPDGKLTPEAERAARALDMLEGRDQLPEKQGHGPPVMFEDKGVPPMRPLPEQFRTPVKEIVARLLARTDTTTSDVLNRLRSRAYPHDALITNFPDCGAGMADGLRTAITTDLRDIAFAAGATAEELDGLIAARQQALAASVDAARQDATALGKDTTAKVAAEGQKTLDAIDGAAKAADEEMLRRQEATSGSADPVVINRRRDLTVNWITEHVTNQTTAYQLAGDQRAKELREARDGQLGGYLALSQREQYEVLTPKPPRPERAPADSARETRLTDLAAEIRAWTDTRVAEIGEAFRKMLAAAANEIKAFRGAVESAGSYARERVREWAEDEVLKGEGWWTRFIARIRRWIKEAEDVNETWRVRRTQAQRDGIALDHLTVSDIEAKMAAGISQEEILKDGTLSEEQRMIVKLYFRKSANEGPLDIAAKGLEERMASDHLERAKTVFETELRATPAAYQQYDIVHKLEDVARSLNPGFDAGKITQDLHSAMDRWGTDEDLIFTSLKGVTPFEGDVIRKMYRARYDLDLDDHIESEMSGDELDQAQAELAGEPSKADAIALHDAVDGIGTNEDKIYETLRNKTPEEIEKIRAEYRKKYGEELDAALKDDLDEGNETDRAMALLKGDTATADAIALDEAMRGGPTGLGTDEAEIEKVLTRVRQEVMARAKTENWNSAQMEAEVRRRLKAISDKFEGRYKDVRQYITGDLTGKTALERAFQSELSGAELDLAEALRKNDPVAADAARLEIERTGFYTSDSKVNGVLRSQYERALEKRRLDEGPARNVAIRRQIDAMREQSYKATGPNAEKLSEDKISEARIKLEREADRAMEKDAAVDAGASMDALTKLYKDRYHVPVEFVVAFGMDGRDQREAFALLKNRGYLSPRQEIELATEGVGTDEDLLKKTFSRLTAAEIEDVRKEWELRHPGENFKDMIRGELSGRDESDIMDMVEHGAPESDSARIDQERRRVDREIRDLTGAFGGAAAGKEAAWMEDQVRRLEALKPDLMRTDWQNTEEDRERRERLAAEVDFRTQRVQDAVEDHRRKLDSFADDIAMAIGVIVAVVISVASLGSLTWVGAIIVSLVGTALTMGAKYAIKGGSYAGADVAIDLAAGVVDAATAGLATKFGLSEKLLEGVGALVSKARLKDVATIIGKSGIAQRALKTPVLGAATRAAGRLLPSAGAIEKGIVRFVAGTAEDAAMSIPSGTVGILASDETWKGDPLHNFLSGGGDTLLQAVVMGKVTHAASHFAGHVATGVRSEIRMGSETGRMREVSRIVNEHYGRFHQENPGASLADFLAHAEGRTLRAEIDKRGLLPTIESANTRARAEGPALAREPGGEVREPTAKPAPEARSGELHNVLPEKLREGSFVTSDESLGGRTVKVEPLMVGKDIVGVDIRVGPDATPLDVALHGATVEAMLKYRGVMGRLRRVMADLGSHLVVGAVKVGSRGWEAKLELDKLPAVLASRMNEVADARMTPETQTHFDMDVAHLQSQIDSFEHVLRNPALTAEPGRGFVAAENKPAKKTRYDRAQLVNKKGVVTEEGRARIQDTIERFSLAKVGAPERVAAVRAIAELTTLPDLTVQHLLTLDAATRAHAEDLMNSIRNVGNEPGDAAHLNDLVARLAEELRISPDDARTLALEPEAYPDLMHLLTGAPATREKRLRAPPGTADTMQEGKGLDELRQKISESERVKPAEGATGEHLPNNGKEIPPPSELVAGIAKGDPKAQALLNLGSRAPAGYEVVNITTAQLEACLTGDPAGWRRGTLQIGDATFHILRPPKTGAEDPPFFFPGDFPTHAQLGDRVLQFGDGRLRVWRGPPESGHPAGRLQQEALVGEGQARQGQEKIALKTYRDALLAGPVTERGHAHGAGLGPESPFGILHVPQEVNQALQNRGIEKYLRMLRDASPKEVEWHYATEVVSQPNDKRLMSIAYRIDVTIRGVRVPFAEFYIHVDPLPAHMAAADVTAQHIVKVDPLEFRSGTHPQVRDILGRLQNLVDVPGFALHGLGRGTRDTAAEAAARLSLFGPDFVKDTVRASDGRLRSINPDPAGTFDATEWAKRLQDHFDSNNWVRFVVVDLRGLNLTSDQVAAIELKIATMPRKNSRRILLIR